MHNRANVDYYYDGTFEGLLCCVFESYDKKEIPSRILVPGNAQLSLCGCRNIRSDIGKYERVRTGIISKINADAYDFLRRAFLTCLDGKEKHMLMFLRKGFKMGPIIMRKIEDDDVRALEKAVRHLGREAHLLSGFLRFSMYGTVLSASITPKNFVLPLIAPHFIHRYPEETFLIFDKTHGAALIYEKHKYKIIDAGDFNCPPPDSDEVYYRRLWKLFYETISIAERYNPVCRRSQMPMRYWENMTEMIWDKEFAERTDKYIGQNRVPELPPYLK